ncbi:BMP family lipoprotein [Brachyspira pulli]|uniref:BMP family lipoprotein n=1 Tax=Brachyspira pulli TaxID=310721 RepID=UPI003AB0675E
MYKKIVLLLLFIILLLSSCNVNMESEDDATSGAEIAVLIDLGTIDDKSFNQSSWEGVEDYAETRRISYQYYKVPQKDKDLDSFIKTVDMAVDNGAKIVVSTGFIFQETIYAVQDDYPDVNFILIDGVPQREGDIKITSNTTSILFAEEEVGFLAGYSVVKDGYTNLGVIAGLPYPTVKRFGYGFIQGADFAASELELDKHSIKIKYNYIGNFDDTEENQKQAENWYNEGVQVIFAPAGGAAYSVMRAAEKTGGLVVGIDVDQSFESPTIITSAVKMIRESVYNAIDNYYKGRFEGGKTVVLDAKVNGVGLPMDNSKFRTFSRENYNNIYKMLVDKRIVVLKDTYTETPKGLPARIVKVDYIE